MPCAVWCKKKGRPPRGGLWFRKRKSERKMPDGERATVCGLGDLFWWRVFSSSLKNHGFGCILFQSKECSCQGRSSSSSLKWKSSSLWYKTSSKTDHCHSQIDALMTLSLQQTISFMVVGVRLFWWHTFTVLHTDFPPVLWMHFLFGDKMLA